MWESHSNLYTHGTRIVGIVTRKNGQKLARKVTLGVTINGDVSVS